MLPETVMLREEVLALAVADPSPESAPDVLAPENSAVHIRMSVAVPEAVAVIVRLPPAGLFWQYQISVS